MTDVLREANASDIDALLRHRCLMFADMGLGTDATRAAMVPTSRAYLERAIADGTYRGWVVERDGRVVASGGIILSAWLTSPFEPQARRAMILNVYTETACRRQGLARKLMDAMIGWCRAEGLRSVSLHASDDGRALYEALGFRPTNEMRLDLVPRPS